MDDKIIVFKIHNNNIIIENLLLLWWIQNNAEKRRLSCLYHNNINEKHVWLTAPEQTIY